MKTCWLLAAGLAFAGLVTAQPNASFLSQPTLTPDGQTVIFSFESDLWKANIKDGIATRLTAMQGYETGAKVSPDGKWIAFTGRQYGNADVFIVPVEGGEVQQLTWYSGADEVSSWSWDAQSVYFTSNRMGQPSTFKTGIDGGTAKRVFGDYFFQYDHNVVEHPISGELFFNDTWESSNQLQRKRYKGPFNPDIQSYQPATKKYTKYTDWVGKDFGATIDRAGHLYFLSDEDNGEYNLYTLSNGKKEALTRFPSSIHYASVSANGEKIVLEKDYQLWLYNVASRQAEKIALRINRNNLLPKEKDFEVRGNITAFDVSPDGKKLAFVSRGELFVSDVEGKFIRQLPHGNEERIREVKWLADNRTLLFNQTLRGYTNWYTLAADGSTGLKQWTTEQRNNRLLVLNKKRTFGVYLSGRDEVRLLNLKTLESKTIAKEEVWAFQNAAPGFSPDGEYVVFTAHRHFEQDLFVHSIRENKTINLTHTAITETEPVWSPDGKYLYFISSRLTPAYPFGLQDPHVYRLPLQKTDAPYRLDKYNELFAAAKKDTASSKDTAVKPLRIDSVKIMDRIEQVGPAFGEQYLLTVLQKNDATILLYAGNQENGKWALYKTVLAPFEAPKTERIAGADDDDFSFAASGEKNYVLFNGGIYQLNLDAGKVDPVKTSFTFRRNLAGEFVQVFEETWAQLQENYYDETFHGVDWNKTKRYYQQFLPLLNNRGDLRLLLNDMLGELNSSHQGFSSFGEEEAVALHNSTMETGILFNNAVPYTVQAILENSPADHQEVQLQKGDVLVKVNGEAVDTQKDRYYYFTKPSPDQELELTFKRGASLLQVKVHPQNSLYDALYDQWIEDNRKLVDEKGHHRIAYACMKNMTQEELEHFIVEMTRQLPGKEALILDLRYNTGGNVHDRVLNFLSQRTYLQWKYREGQLTPQPNFAPSDRPIVLLTNEQSLSDAEMTAAGFKALKLGKIVGNETYHWIIFTSGAGMVDRSFVRLPAWGCYTLDGKDLEFNGVQPDIRVVNTFQDKISGKDPQLDKAIETILQQLGK